MKKILLLPFLLFAAFSMVACGGGSDEPSTPEQPEIPGSEENPSTPTPGTNGRYLVLFASRSGNTERLAKEICAQLDCDILEVEPKTAYDDNYNAMLSRAQEELAAIRQGNFPPIKTSMDSFDKYDIIFIGYPIWYGSMATPMQTFLHSHASKLAGKQIALFATSGSSGISTSVNEARQLCPDAKILDQTLLLTSSGLSQMTTRISSWLNEIGACQDKSQTPEGSTMKVKITIGTEAITATMEDNAASRDFLSRLPLEVTLNDYNNTTEKIFYPNPALTTEDVTRGCAPTPGDIAIYVPWGNIAFFCKDWSHSNDLIKIGHIDNNGIDALNTPGDIIVKFEKQ